MKPNMKIVMMMGLLAAAGLANGCGGGGGGTTEPEQTYQELVTAGWSAFASGDLSAAITSFNAAVQKDGSQAEAFSGLGWANLYLSGGTGLAAADSAFAHAVAHAGSAAVLADAYAGWAFLANAQHSADLTSYVNSNARIAQVASRESPWTFSHSSSLGQAGLNYILADNHYALGELAAAKSAIQLLAPSFDADLGTPEGQAAFVAELESLRSTLSLPGAPAR
jgi:hypothetical protein